MIMYCEKSNQGFEYSEKECPICGAALMKRYTEEELKQIQEENDTYTVLHTTGLI